MVQVSLAVGLTGWLSVRNGQQAVNDVAGQLRQEVSLRIEQKLNEFLAAPHLINRINQDAIRMGYVNPQDPDALYAYFFRQAQQFDTVDAIFFGNANGEFIGNGHFGKGRQHQIMRAGPSLDGFIQFWDVDATGRPLRLSQSTPGWVTQTRPWYKAAVEAGGAVWGEIFTYHAYPVMAMPAASPVYAEDGTLIGVLGNNFFLSHVGDFLRSLHIGQHGQMFIMERSGLLVASSTLSQPFTLVGGRPQRIDAATSQDPLIRASTQFLLAQYGGNVWGIQAAQQHVFRYDNQRQFLQVMPYQDELGLDWLIVVVVPESDFMAQIQANTRNTVILCLLALVGAIASGLVTSRWITKPIWRLNQAAQAIARGDLHQTVATAGLKELELLVQAFNSMALRLEFSFSALHQSKQDLERANMSLKEQASLFRLIAENMSDLVCLHQPEGHFLYVSPSVEWLLGYSPEALIGVDPYTLFHPADCDRIRQEAHQAALSGLPSGVTYRMRHQAGHYIWLETITRPITDANGQVIRLQSASRDVTETVRMRKQLEHDALHDALTGLPNRNLLMERLAVALQRVQRHPDYRFAVLFLDLDRFKVVNDSLGHLTGDELLIEIAHRLKTVLRAGDLAARLGGDEFILLLDDIADVSDAIRITEQIFLTLRRPLRLNGHEMFATVSIGIVISMTAYHHPSELIRDADIAMYRAKAKGRDCYEIYDATMHQQALARLQVENDLRKALLETPDAFILHYQPIVDLPTGTVKGFEALVRWQHPQHGLLAPNAFIPIAEETGLIIPLSQGLMTQACRQLKTWQDTYVHARSLTMSVNLSAAQLHDTQLMHQIDQMLAATGLAPTNLVLELTESMLVDNLEQTADFFQWLRERSIAISIDDFGTGYSSLSYLYRFPIHTLKIDRSFIHQMLTSQNHRKIVETIITLASQLGFQTIAEGIETPDEVRALKTLRCDYGQGYWFGKPQSADSIEAWLRLGVAYFRQ